MAFLLAAISLGFLGSFHCLGMCGPIALALPIGKLNTAEKVFGIFLYNFGRVLTYTTFGIIFGSLGKTFVLFGYQQVLSISLGLIILLSLFLPSSLFLKIKFDPKIYNLSNKLKTTLSQLFSREGKKSLFFIGLLNGLLPCGMVYMAVAGAIASSDLLKGALFMAFFGLGTAPMMFLIPLAGNQISISFRNKIRKIVPVMVGLMAIVLILRGLNLGIPYLSPEINDTKEIPVCHTLTGKKVCVGLNKN